MQYTNDGMYVVERKVCLVSAVRSVGCCRMYVVEEKGVSSLCCEECDAMMGCML